jgi:hypothetical protein
MASNFDPYWEWLKIPANQQPPNHYQLLGLKPLESSIEAIDEATDRLVEKMQRLSNGPQVEAAQKILNQVAQARLCLSDPDKKQFYDRQLTARLASQQSERVSTTTPSLRPALNKGRPSNPGKPAESTHIPTANAGRAPTTSSPESKAKAIEGNRQVQLMKLATVAMLVMGGTVGWLFVWLVSGKPAARSMVQTSVNVSSAESTSIVTSNQRDELKQMGQTSDPTDSAVSETAMPIQTSSQANEVQPQKDAVSQAAMTIATVVDVDQTEASRGSTRTKEPAAGTNPSVAASDGMTTSGLTTTPATTLAPAPLPSQEPPAPGNNLQTIPGLTDTFVPAKSELFEPHIDVVVGLQGQVVSSRTSSTGKTVYLMFSAARNDLIEIRARANKVSLEDFQAFAGKKVRVRGEIQREFGSRIIGLEIETVEQIEIVE